MLHSIMSISAEASGAEKGAKERRGIREDPGYPARKYVRTNCEGEIVRVAEFFDKDSMRYEVYTDPTMVRHGWSAVCRSAIPQRVR